MLTWRAGHSALQIVSACGRYKINKMDIDSFSAFGPEGEQDMSAFKKPHGRPGRALIGCYPDPLEARAACEDYEAKSKR